MSEVRYLYGAAVQGIQSFIFQTNKLREIVGASELVEEVCTEVFKAEVGELFHEYDGNTGAVLMASGHIKYIFYEDDFSLAKVVKNMPKRVQEHASGIIFSQAVVEMTGKYATYDKAVEELESRLKIQRNKPMRSQTLGLMGILRSRQTGLPVTNYEDKEFMDAAAYAKIFDSLNSNKKRKGEQIRSKTIPDEEKRNLLLDLENKGGINNWIAVIHIDGNGLGTVVEEVCKLGADKFNQFSIDLDNAVKVSAKEAFNAVKDKFGNENIIPIRPLILSGEDYNLICRADFAVEYVKAFLQKFEEETKFINKYVKNKTNLTACAGIAFVKSSFPFYYAYDLANGLCDFAKKQSERKASCLMFHKVQDSFTESYDEIVKRELSPTKSLSFCYGPYYLDHTDNTRTIKWLDQKAKDLKVKEGNAVKSHLRQWMSLLHDNADMAEQKLERLKNITSLKKLVEELTETRTDNNKMALKNPSPVYDVLTIHTIRNQVTK